MDNVIQGPWKELPERISSDDEREISSDNVVIGLFPEKKHKEKDKSNEDKTEKIYVGTHDYFSLVLDERKQEYINCLKAIKIHTDGLITTASKLLITANHGINDFLTKQNVKSIQFFETELNQLYKKIEEFIPPAVFEDFKDDNLFHLVWYILNTLYEELEKRDIDYEGD